MPGSAVGTVNSSVCVGISDKAAAAVTCSSAIKATIAINAARKLLIFASSMDPDRLFWSAAIVDDMVVICSHIPSAAVDQRAVLAPGFVPLAAAVSPAAARAGRPGAATMCNRLVSSAGEPE